MAESTVPGPSNRHALSAVEKQRSHLEKLLKDPAKPAYIPPPPKEKTIRPPREMMKNVQGSSAGAGSGEFHVYKASRRREYERLKLMEEAARKEAEAAEFERKRREAEEKANAKTAKNRVKRQKKKEKERSKGRGEADNSPTTALKASDEDLPFKKRRLANDEKELVFRRPGEEREVESDEAEQVSIPPALPDRERASLLQNNDARTALEASRITIIEED